MSSLKESCIHPGTARRRSRAFVLRFSPVLLPIAAPKEKRRRRNSILSCHPSTRVDQRDGCSLDPLHDDRVVLIFDLHLASAPCLVDGNVWMILVKIRVVVFGLLPYLPVVQLENCVSVPAMHFAGNGRFNRGHAATLRCRRWTWDCLRFCFRLTLHNGEIKGAGLPVVESRTCRWRGFPSLYRSM